MSETHRSDCCDNCGKASECTKIVSRCWPDHHISENCEQCVKCHSFENIFIVRPLNVSEAQ